MKNTWMLVTYYTPEYEDVFFRCLKSSLDVLKSLYYIEKIPDLGGWKENTDYKPEFILKSLNMFSSDIVITDVDSQLNEYPVLFDNIPKEYDIAVHTMDWFLHYGRPTDVGKSELLSGTLYLRNNTRVKKLVKLWIEKSKYHSWEQQALQEAIKEMGELIKVYDLPREYCYITSTPKRINNGKVAVPIKNPIIEHYQVSRKLKVKR